MQNDIRIGMDNSNVGAYGKLFVIPQDPSDREFLLSVDRRARAELNRIYGILVDYDWQANTIANSVIETLITDLAFMLKNGANNGIGIEFYDIIKAIVSIKTNEKAEKEGNINIYFEPGSKVTSLIENGPENIEYEEKLDPAKRFLTGDPAEDDLYKNLEYHTRYNLSSVNGITIPDHLKFSVFAIGYTFIECIYLEILYRLANMDAEDGEEKLVSVNFNDNIEIHGIMKNGTVNITMRPGMNAKLLIKCDEITEHTMGDDE
jgi:hypothetical protein